ncbi:hypothetical protein GC197_09020 [bacterium]|nr:hypothetical protein [bacterium]
MPEINRKLTFDAGIEQITAYIDQTPSQLPEGGQFVPGEAAGKQYLDEVLFPPSVEQTLIESFRPKVTERQLLTAPGYHHAHDQCMEDLGESLKEFAGRPGEEKLQAMAQVLQDVEGLRNLFNTYRNLLHQA